MALIAPFAAEYGPRPGMVTKAAADEMDTIGARPPREHPLQRSAAAVEQPEQVDIDDLSPGRGVEPVGQAHALDASVVDQDVHPALVGVDVLECGLHLLERGHVRPQVARPVSSFLGVAQIDGHDPCALGEERPTDGVPDATRPTRDDDHPLAG